MNWYKIAQEREYPIAAAVIADGKVFEGHHHGEAIQKAIDQGYALHDKDGYLVDRAGNDMTFSGATDLFRTNKGRLIDRFQAFQMGEATGSESIPKEELNPSANSKKLTKIAQTGEWWIIDGQAEFADSDTGDIGHEGIVLDMLRREIAESFGVDWIGEYYDWDEVKQECINKHFEEQSEEDQMLILKKWKANDKDELIRKVPYDSDIFDTIAQEEGVSKMKIDVADNSIDPRDYGLKELGWKRVAQDNIQTWTLTRDDLHDISNGIDHILEGFNWDDGREVTYNIEVGATGKFYSNVPTTVIEKLNPMAMREYENSFNRAYAKSKNWYRIALLVDRGEGPEETFVQCMYCNRFATSPTSQDINPIWKTMEEMDEQERSAAIRATETFKNDIAGNIFEKGMGLTGISTGMCPECTADFLEQNRKRVEERNKKEVSELV